MVTVTYRLVGDVNNPTLRKEFKTSEEVLIWAKAQGNILILEVESTSVVAMKRLFG